jgi:hypothetical protein
MKRTKIAVIAGNYHQYRDFLKEEWPLGRNAATNEMFEFFYVSDKQGLLGFHGQVILRGTYWENLAYKYYDKEYRAFEYVNSQTDREWDA